jgi:hypothetical protein
MSAGRPPIVEPGREPALHQIAAIGLTALVGAEHVLGRVAAAAMRRALDQIGATIPFVALLAFLSNSPRRKNKRFQPRITTRSFSGQRNSGGGRVLRNGVSVPR